MSHTVQLVLLTHFICQKYFLIRVIGTNEIVNLRLLFLKLLEGTARYAGLLLAPAEGFSQGFAKNKNRKLNNFFKKS